MKTNQQFRCALRTLAMAACVGAVFCLVSQVASACPMCQESLAANKSGGNLINGFFWSIVFMMSMPFALIGSFGLYAWRQVRKARAAAEAGKVTESGDATTVAQETR